LALLKKYPTPQRLAAARLSSLSKLPYVNAATAEKLHATAKSTIAALRGEVAEKLVIHQVEQLETCLAAVKNLEKLLVQSYRAVPPSGHAQIETIPGIGTMTAAVLVAKMISLDRFATPENLVGYFGVFPEANTSGVDRDGKPIPPGTMRMSAKGADLVRRYLWNAAKSAVQCNPAVRELYARLRARGTRGDVALGHCMRKLLHQVFGVWASDQPYDETASMPRRRMSINNGDSPTDPPAPLASADETTTAAGHKGEVIPQRKVVTAATLSVDPTAERVKNRASIDYAFLREQITLEQILKHLGWLDRFAGRGAQRYGSCPFHAAKRAGSRSLCINLKKHVFRCCNPTCQAHGNALDFWANVHRLPLYEAAIQLAETFHLQTCRIEKRQPVTLNL
jgi:hypothetical protein